MGEDEEWFNSMAALVLTAMFIIVILGLAALGFWLWGWI